MLITNDFVLLNVPKTGSSFTRKIIKKVYKDKCEELLLRVMSGRTSQHGTYAQIPDEHRGKIILSIIRNPFDRYVSQYHFKWYSHSSPVSPDILKSNYPSFPEISFIEFLDMMDRFNKLIILKHHGISANTDIGFQTIHFAAFFTSSPEQDLRALIDEKSEHLLKIPRIHFLRQEYLRRDLIDFLSPYHGHQIIRSIVDSESDENVSRGIEDRNWKKYWTPDLLETYRRKEAPLLNIFSYYR